MIFKKLVKYNQNISMEIYNNAGRYNLTIGSVFKYRN